MSKIIIKSINKNSSISKKSTAKDESKNLDFKDIVTIVKKANLTDFTQRVYLATIQIPAGYVATYKLIAQATGNPNSSRAVGTALRNNPYAPYVPCHRVITSDGKIGGFFGSKNASSENVQRKIKLLEDEGIEFDGVKILNLKKVLFTEFV